MTDHTIINPAAVIFDMDGLMFDTERLAQKAWRRAAAICGYDFSEEVFRGVIGRTLPKVEQFTYQTFGSGFPFDEVYRFKQELLHTQASQQGIPIKPGLQDLLDFLDQTGLRKAVASSSSSEIITRNLQLAGLPLARFDALVGGDEVQNGKPAPDIFLLASRRLGIAVENCLVLEDSNAGVKAAYRAGMIPVMIPDLIPPSQESNGYAYRILPSLSNVREIILP